ncbi:MAG: AbrB/MazE/SpoVT family DNA-binding domain-containing protein [Chloroflexi bacterium]|nr:AbrB/MazE/SpoVT family DNA-binding domain-containing protein [Chloroflexota bacterium]
MPKEIKVRKVGGSVSATLPKEMADRFGIEPGDTLLAIETADGILLTPYEPLTREALQIAATAAKKYRNALRQLSR